MANSNGYFVWHELMTTDLAAARAFYGSVVGWKATDAQMPNMNYWMFNAGETPIAGATDLPQDAKAMGTPPSWVGYVAVDDVDATTAKVTASGGKVYVAPKDIPNVGRFAIVADPGGAAIAVYKSANPDQDQAPDPEKPGHPSWHELYAADGAAAFDFYSRIFGWEKQEAMDMGGDMGVYQMFGFGKVMLGGMMNKPANLPVPFWNYYFNVGNIDEAVERVKAGGGQVTNGPDEVPGGSFAVQGMDPQGAAFGLLGKR